MANNNGRGTIGKYGPGIIGKEQYEAEKQMVETSSWKYGPGVNDPKPMPPVNVPAVEVTKGKKAGK